MSRQKKCLYQKIIALVCLFAVCLTGFAAYFAIKNTGSVQAAEYTFTDSSGNQVGDGGRIAMRRSRDTFAVLGIQSNDVCTWQSLNPSLVEIENADAAGFKKGGTAVLVVKQVDAQIRDVTVRVTIDHADGTSDIITMTLELAFSINEYLTGVQGVKLEKLYPEDSRKQVKAGMVFVIAPEREVALENREVPIYKYQPGDQILAEMIRQCSMSGDEKQIFLKITGKKNCRVIAVYSPVRRIGKTTYAIRLGRKLAKEANVLYLGMETYGGEGGHFPEGTQTLADVLYYARQEQSNIGTVLTTIVRHSENLDYIVPMPVSEDIKEIDSEEWIRLIQKIIEQSIYEIVILDMDEGVRDIYRVLRICNEIHMLTIDEPVAEAKVAQFEAELELLGYEDVRRKIIRKEQRT